MARRSSAAVRTRRANPIVDLSEARDARRLRDYEERIEAVVEGNKRALSRLFQSGLVYTRQGARLGRDLLLAHMHLLKVVDLLAKLAELSAEKPRGPEAEALYGKMQSLLARTTALTARSDGLFSRY